MTYDSTGTLFGSPVHCRAYFVELPDKFARLTCSCGGEHWDQSGPMLDDLVKHMT